MLAEPYHPPATTTPHVDYTRREIAFGRRGVPKLIEQLSGPVDGKHLALTTLCDTLHDPRNVALALASGVVEELLRGLADKDVERRRKSIECLLVLSGHAIGREAILGEGSRELSRLFEDQDTTVRLFVYEIYAQISASVGGTEQLLSFNPPRGSSPLVAALLARLPQESLLHQPHILKTLYNLIRFQQDSEVVNQLLNAKPTLLDILVPSLPQLSCREVGVGILNVLAVFGQYKETKAPILAAGVVEKVVAHLSHRCVEIRGAAAGCLMALTIDVEAKRILARDEAVLKRLVQLLEEKDETLVLNVVRVVTNVSEDYRGRFGLHGGLRQLEKLHNSPNSQLANAARRAVEVITWRP
ncbi:Radial spoke head 14 [Gaertneriomyces sp. JEL0708]|nr:Radial spoke head 14 [Gaertneriomyces sp. JEL0708]